MKQTLMLLLLAAVAAGVLTGCNKFTQKRYALIQTGMAELEVEKILGSPDKRFSDSWTYTHDDPYYRAKILFRNGRVVDKAWADMKGIEDDPDGKTAIRKTPEVIQETTIKVNVPE